MEKSKDKILDTISKLFKMTEGNGASEEEAKTAVKNAQLLMAKHGITMTELEVGDYERDETIEPLVWDVAVTPWAWRLQQVIAENFACKPMMSISSLDKRYKRIVFCGHKTDAEIALRTFQELYIIGEVLCGPHIRKMYRIHGYEKGFKKSFLQGYVDGIKEALNENKQQYGLIVVVPQDVIEFMEDTPLRRAPLMRDTSFQEESYEEGKKEGASTVKIRKVEGE